MATRTESTSGTIEPRTIAVRGGIAVALSLLANWLVLGAVLESGAVEPLQALSVPPVTTFTVAGAVGATLAYWLSTRRSASPNRAFTRLAAVVLVLSFVPDVALLATDPAATVPAVVVLMAMHVTVAAICVAVLTARLRPGA